MNQMYGFEGEVKEKYTVQMAEFFTEVSLILAANWDVLIKEKLSRSSHPGAFPVLSAPHPSALSQKRTAIFKLTYLLHICLPNAFLIIFKKFEVAFAKFECILSAKGINSCIL